jgi:hypothetical protein
MMADRPERVHCDVYYARGVADLLIVETAVKLA